MPSRALVAGHAVARPRAAPSRGTAAPLSPARVWGPRFLGAALFGSAGCFVVGMPWALSGLTLAAVAVLLVGVRQPVVAALAMTAVAVLDGHAADTLQPTLALLTGGLWRYNTIGYAVLAVMLIGLQLLLDVMAFFGLLFVFARVADDPECWDWIGLVGGTLGAGAGLAYVVNVGHMHYTNPNVAVFAPLTGMMAVCLAFGAGTRAPQRQTLLGVLAIVNLLWAFLSSSRGGLLTGLAGAAFIWCQVQDGRRRALMLGSMVALALVVAALFTPLQRTAVQRFSLLFDQRSGLETRTSGRSDLMLGSWAIFQRQPLGVGTGGFETTWATLGSVGGQRRFMRAGEKFAAHAGWMRVLAENGVPGFVALAAFVASFAVAGVARRHSTARNLGLLATAVLALALVTSEFHLKGLFFVAAAVAAIVAVRRRPARVAVTFRRPLVSLAGPALTEDMP